MTWFRRRQRPPHPPLIPAPEDVLREHELAIDYAEYFACTCGTIQQTVNGHHPEHVAAALSAAGFGPVREAAAAGVRSVYEIWCAGGRATVRMGEIQKVDKTILSGEWDNHIKWNMADIARERARAEREASS